MIVPLWVYSLPYIEGGRSRDGVDCWGLIVLLYKHFYNVELDTYPDIRLPSIKEYCETADRLKKEIAKQSYFIEVDAPLCGDVILMNILGQPIHIGFCLDNSNMIHTGREHGVVIENFTETKWKSRIAGFYRKQ